MRDFQRKAGRLRALPFEARLVYTVFLGFTLAGFALTAMLFDEMVGIDVSRVGQYYAGQPAAVEPATAPAEVEPTAADGPSFDLPDELLEPPEATSMSHRKLLEVTHFHLFSMPVYLLILSHLYMLSLASGRTKSVWIALASLSTVAHVAAPWLAASGTDASGALYALSGVGMTVSYLVMSVVPLREMWAPAPKTE